MELRSYVQAEFRERFPKWSSSRKESRIIRRRCNTKLIVRPKHDKSINKLLLKYIPVDTAAMAGTVATNVHRCLSSNFLLTIKIIMTEPNRVENAVAHALPIRPYLGISMKLTTTFTDATTTAFIVPI